MCITTHWKSDRSPTYKVAEYLANILRKYSGKRSSHVQSSSHSISLLFNISFDLTDVLASFDLKSLFTKVSIPYSDVIIQDLLGKKEISRLFLLINVSLRPNFPFKETLHTNLWHTNGFLSFPVIADVFMRTFEDVALQSFSDKTQSLVSVYWRYFHLTLW